MLSALLVAVPAAEPAVAAHRGHLDPSAAWGVPAHVTVLFPFLPVPSIDDLVLARAAAAIASVPRFVVTFPRTRWFGSDVLWLEPEPVSAFDDLIAAVMVAFPQCPPYGGEYGVPTAHLTIGRNAASVDELESAEGAVAPHLPIEQGVASVLLMAGREEAGSWSALHEFPLG